MKYSTAAVLLLVVTQPGRSQSADDVQQFRSRLVQMHHAMNDRFRYIEVDVAELKADRKAGRTPDPATESRLEEAIRAVRQLSEEHTQLTARVAALEGRVGTLESRVSRLEAESASLREVMNRRPVPTPAPLSGTRTGYSNPLYSNPLYYNPRTGLPISSYSPVFGSATTHYRNSMP